MYDLRRVARSISYSELQTRSNEMTQRPPTRKPSKDPRKKAWLPPQVKTGKLFESNSFACNKVVSDFVCNSENPPPISS
jgi:hypothetical protein